MIHCYFSASSRVIKIFRHGENLDQSFTYLGPRNFSIDANVKNSKFDLNFEFGSPRKKLIKVLRPSGPNYWKIFEWILHVFCKEYCSECQTYRVMGQKFGTITFCHL